MEKINGKLVVLGLQHTFVMFGATVLVPLITGLDVGVTLLMAGIGTWVFHILTKFEVPVFLGSSFAFIPGIIAVSKAQGGSLSEACGGLVMAGFVYILASVVFKKVGHEKLHLILPPHVTGPVIILIGLLLAPVAINNATSAYSPHVIEKIGLGGSWFIALFTFGVAAFIKIFFEERNKLVSMLPVLIALFSGYILSIMMGVVDFSSVMNASWIGSPKFTIATFTMRGASIIVPVAIVTIVEHFGDVLAIGNVVDKDFIKEPGVHRTILGDGIATSLSAFFGGPANTTYSENTGAVALTGAKNPVIMRIAACFAILLAFIPKFTAIIGSIPGPVIGGISILLFGMISSIGISNMIRAKIDFADPRPLMVTATILVIGLGNAAIKISGAELKGLGFAALFGIILNAIFLMTTKGHIKKLEDK